MPKFEIPEEILGIINHDINGLIKGNYNDLDCIRSFFKEHHICDFISFFNLVTENPDELNDINFLSEYLKYMDINDNTLLHLVVQGNNLKAIEFLCKQGINIEALNREGYRALHCAVSNGLYEATELLLKYGADVNVRDRIYMPLHYTAMMDRADLALLLLKNGADLFAEDISGLTPEFYAKDRGHKNILELFVCYELQTMPSSHHTEQSQEQHQGQNRYGTFSHPTITSEQNHGHSQNPDDSDQNLQRISPRP